MVHLIQGRIEDEFSTADYINNSIIKIFFNIIMTHVNEEMSPIEIIIRHTETMISYLIIAVIVS